MARRAKKRAQREPQAVDQGRPAGVRRPWDTGWGGSAELAKNLQMILKLRYCEGVTARVCMVFGRFWFRIWEGFGHVLVQGLDLG